MRLITKAIVVSIFILLAGCSSPEPEVSAEAVMEVPVKNTVTLVDLGATTCVPCKLMEPILEELKAEYKGRAEIVFIDVYEETEKAQKFEVAAIPTQVFFDRQGNEVFRHLGFLDKDAIVSKLEELLVD